MPKARTSRRRKQDIYSKQNQARLIMGGKPYFDEVCHVISKAEKQIHFQVYIFEDDDTGKRVANELKAAAERKVDVYLMIDGYASRKLKPAFIREMETSGIRFRFFDPLFKSKNFYFGRRMHHKILVADASVAIVTGANITDRYNDMPDKPGWLDFAVVVEGEAATELCKVCWITWNNYMSGTRVQECNAGNTFNFPNSERCEISVRRNDWVRRKNEISFTYIDMLRRAQEHVIILCSYFLPGKQIRRQLSHASRRGVQITVITAGISDIMLSKFAERYWYAWLLRNKIRVYEYQPRILHGKIAVADSSWLTIGSYNVNNLSAYASIELNLNIHQEKLAREAEDKLLAIAANDCIHITDEFLKRTDNVLIKFGRWASFQILRFILYLFTFYFKHQR